jgi:hypothetical protein
MKWGEFGCRRGWQFAGGWGEVTELGMESVDGSIADCAVCNPGRVSGERVDCAMPRSRRGREELTRDLWVSVWVGVQQSRVGVVLVAGITKGEGENASGDESDLNRDIWDLLGTDADAAVNNSRSVIPWEKSVCVGKRSVR